MEARTEILLMDKPVGVTSFRFLDPVKKKYPKSVKVGHAGTLDRFASGLMIVLVGNATRLNPLFSSMDKSYEAVVRFGSETDTLDPDGSVVRTSPVPDEETVDRVLPSFIGVLMQRPPEYSAIHVDGRRAYRNAVHGVEFEMPERKVEVFSLEKLFFDGTDLGIRVHVSKGTYIRSLARDIGRSCGSAAHLCGLRRISIGPYDIGSCLGYDTARILEETGLLGTVVYSDRFEKEIVNGMILDGYIESISPSASDFYYMYIGKRLYAVASRSEGRTRVLARF